MARRTGACAQAGDLPTGPHQKSVHTEGQRQTQAAGLHAVATTPAQRLGVLFRSFALPYQPSPISLSGRPAHCPFRGLLGVHSRCGLHTRAVTVCRDTLIEGFSHFVTSMTAPIASGWSGCRVGLAPTGKRRLVTAHVRSGHCASIAIRSFMTRSVTSRLRNIALRNALLEPSRLSRFVR